MSPCIDCGRAGTPSAASSESFRLARCQTCGLIYFDGWEELFEREKAFNSGNVSYYERIEMDSSRSQMCQVNLDRIVQVLERLESLVHGRRLLDVGCGKGEVVAAASRLGWSAMGIDLAPGAIRIAQANGENCRNLDFFDSALDDQQFDLIYMSEFIEHVPAPGRFLKRAHDLLAANGRVYITTPNFDSLGRRILGPAWNALFPGHVSFFTSRTLCARARSTGFAVERRRTTGVSVAALRSLVGRSARVVPTKSEQYAAVAELRESVESSRFGSALRAIGDPAIGVSGLGETLQVTLRKA